MGQILLKNLKHPLFRLMMTLLGAFISSIAINALYIPNNILSGGVTGIAILLNHKLGLSTALVILLINIPIFIVGYKLIHKEFIYYSFIGMIALTVFIVLTKNVSFHSQNMLTIILFGGVLNGLGAGLVLRSGASSGGTDIISKLLNRKYSYSISTISFAFNLLIIGLSVTTFGIDKSIETLTAMYVTSLTITFILEGTNHKRTIFIITDKEDLVASEINRKLGRGCTILQGMGSYTKAERHILYAVISINQVAQLKAIVSHVDPKAFINVMETRVVFGKGFVDIEED